jgi:hypothetical protein
MFFTALWLILKTYNWLIVGDGHGVVRISSDAGELVQRLKLLTARKRDPRERVRTEDEGHQLQEFHNDSQSEVNSF